MRTVNFRDGVLHAVAYKLGLDPDQSNFLTNQAIPIGTYIDEWVRRVYDSRDWPEWTLTDEFIPTSHIVPYDYLPAGFSATTKKLGRILKVYLVNPEATDAPVDTPFTLLDSGVHVGYEHGTNVWIRYLAPPPRFTAVQWLPNFSYSIGDVVYSYTTGECYLSRVNNNLGQDPSVSGHPLPPPPDVEITQELIPDNPGVAGRTEIMSIFFTEVLLPPDPPDPPLAGEYFSIGLWDGDGVTFGLAFHTADGSESLDDIITAMATALGVSLGGGFTVTPNLTTKSIQVEADLYFTTAAAFYGDTESVQHNFRVKVTQTYIPPLAASSGVPQIARITISSATTFPGATYTLTVIDSLGVQHSVEYESLMVDAGAQILQGILLAVEASSDTYFDGVTMSFDPDQLTLDLSVKDQASVDVVTDRPAPPPGGAYWGLIPFPKALADQVIRGAYGDLLKEWGQADKGAMEEQSVPSEAGVADSKFQTTPNPALTGQQGARSRYKV